MVNSLVTLEYLKYLWLLSFAVLHLSIYGNNVDNLELVSVRHGKCIIIE